MTQTLLIVDDEPGIIDTLRAYWSPQYQVLTARSGQEAVQKAEQQPDLILLDISMPGMDGLTVCRTIRDHVTCPILFLTARIESADQIVGFQAGADDYIVKPFDLDELAARVAAHLRREQRHNGPSAVRFFGECAVDYAARTVAVCGESVPLSRREFDILELLSLNPTVADDGPGFFPELLKNGPRPFGKRSEAGGHFGMGLYSSGLLCRKHGGELRLENRERGGAIAIASLKINRGL